MHMLTDFQPWLESLNVTIPRNYATNGNMFQWRGLQNFGWINVWSLKPEKSHTWFKSQTSIQPNPPPLHSPKDHIPICSIISWCGYTTAVSHGQTGHLFRLEYKNTSCNPDYGNPARQQWPSTNSPTKITTKSRTLKSFPKNPATWTGSS